MMMALTSFMKERKLTQSHAAKIMGVSQPRISDLVGGQASGVVRKVAYVAVLDKKMFAVADVRHMGLSVIGTCKRRIQPAQQF
jgi:predicted XRE-type DNA-binding protein